MEKTCTKQMTGIAKCLETKTLRMLRGPYSQAELALRLQVSQNAITDYESGRFSPRMRVLRGLLVHYNEWTAKLAGPALDLITPNRRKAGGK